MALTSKQRLFVDEYLKCWNKTEAARRAGYSEGNLSESGRQAFNAPGVRAEIEERFHQSAMSADEALAHVAQIARGEWAAAFYVSDAGTFKFDPVIAEKLGLLNLIQESSPVPGTVNYRFKFPSRMDALKTLLTALGILKSDISPSEVGRFLDSLAAAGSAKDRSSSP